MPISPLWQAIDWHLVGIWIAAILTLVTLSAAFGESRLSRAGFGVLIGITVGYTAAITWRAVLWPRILQLAQDPARYWPLAIWFLLGLLLLTRSWSSASWLSNPSLAYLVGIGAALAIGGAVLGTAVPQVMAVLSEHKLASPSPLAAIANPLLVALGTGGVLFRFAYTGQEGKRLVGRLWAGLVRVWGRIGYAFLIVGLGALFATAVISLLTLLTSRLQFLLVDWLQLTGR